MDSVAQPKRCPHCQALVVDRRSPVCTTCQAELPKEWVMSKDQVAKLDQIDVDSRKEHAEAMQKWNRIKSSSEFPTI